MQPQKAMKDDNTPENPPADGAQPAAADQPNADETAANAAEPQPETPADPRDAHIAQLEQEAALLKDQALRALAEVENIRRRAARDVEESGKYAVTGFARDLISVIENLGRATGAIPAEAQEKDPLLKNLYIGVDMTMKELLAIFQRHGIRRIDPMGEKFDHNFHQAVTQIETAEKEPGTIVQVLQAGYVLHDRLLRPAMVGVAKAPGGEAPRQVDTQA